MTKLLAVSPIQMLDLWDELHSAMNGVNRYGGDVGEFYFYRLTSHSPGTAANPQSTLFDDGFYDAACNLYAFCRLFEERHEVEIVFEDGGNIDQLLDKTKLHGHRIHLRVVPKAETA
jgi:hypothetical protein